VLLQEFTEIESGRRPDRPHLAEALRLCRLTGAKLVVARLDRLARNVSFICRVMESKVEFEAVDFPEANRLTVHIMAAVAEYESRLISERTKAALAAAKARGVKFGNSHSGIGNPAALAKGRAAQSARAADRARDLAPLIAELTANGYKSRSAIARILNARGIRSARGGPWTGWMLRKILDRLSIRIDADDYYNSLRAIRTRWLAQVSPVIAQVVMSGARTPDRIARGLNRRKIPAQKGGPWSGILVRTVRNDLMDAAMNPLDPASGHAVAARTIVSGIVQRRNERRNAVFKRGSIVPEALRVLRRARKPMGIREIALAMLKRKGVETPSWTRLKWLCNAVYHGLRYGEGKSVRRYGRGVPMRWRTAQRMRPPGSMKREFTPHSHSPSSTQTRRTNHTKL
jgi:DNA invertase Pin-like site-specific DNA recombinase